MENRIGRPAASPTVTRSQADEFLRRSTATDIGPRKPGVIYYDGHRLVEVRRIIADQSEARRVLRRRSAQYAIEVVDLNTGTPYYTGAVWTGSDRVLKAVA